MNRWQKTRFAKPSEYRLARRNGELILQGLFPGSEQHSGGIHGWVSGSSQWCDIETVDLGYVPSLQELWNEGRP